jgi:DNA polymerase-3 subunit gamma/tau
VTLVKAAGEASADPAASEAERARAADLAARLPMPSLARAWQMLLKGHEEVRASPRPLAAADMVLVRLAYASDLPPPSELARRVRDGSGAGEKAPAPAAPPPKPVRKPAPTEAKAAPAQTSPRQREDKAPESENPAPPAEPTALPELHNFDDVVALAEAKRDLKLKHAQLEQVRLVHFKPGNIELNPLPQAAKDLTQELMRKLKAWTGRVWIVAVSDEPGAEPLGAQRRDRDAREIEKIREHPKVKEVLQHFPDARIAAVRPTVPLAGDDEAGEESDELKEDGTTR